MARLLINLIKSGALLAVICGALLLTFGMAIVHYQGQVAALDLMGLESAPLAQDALTGWLFETVAGEANYTNWLAFGLTGSITLFAWLSGHFGFELFRLLSEARDYIRAGRGADFWRTVANHALRFAVAAAALTLLVLGDLHLFQHRSLAGVMGIDDPMQAAGSIPAIGALASSDFAISTIAFFSGVGGIMYIALAVAPAIGTELVAERFYDSLIKLEESAHQLWLSLTNADGNEGAQTLYGYDADGQPVFDPGALIAYDTDQNPVPPPQTEPQAAPAATEADPAAAAGPATAEATPQPAANDGRVVVIGGVDGQRVKLSEALARPDLYHYCREQGAVFTRSYWQALHAETVSEPADPANDQTFSHPGKEAA